MNANPAKKDLLHSEPGSVLALWIGWIAAPGWWLAQFELRYAAVRHASAHGERWLVAALGVGAWVVAIAITLWCARKRGAAAPSRRFIGLGATVLSGLFAALVFIQLLPDLFLDPFRR